MRDRLAAKLRPDRFTEMSPRMAAIVGYILGEPFSEPAIAEMVVTSDGLVLVRAEGGDKDELLGREADLDRNLLDLITAAGLTEEEVREFGRLQRERIKRYGRREGCAVAPCLARYDFTKPKSTDEPSRAGLGGLIGTPHG